ncbi:MAG: class I SAM-dependent methyltransferase [Actinomycetota bacterium]
MSLRGAMFAMMYDRSMAGPEKAGLAAHRAALLAGVSGQVLEIGGGTGPSLPCYGPGVDSLTMTEPEAPMLRRLQQRIQEQAPQAKAMRVTALRAPAEDLPFEDDSFDVVVSVLVLCTVSDQPRALREIHRVLRPGGQLRFIEHVRSGEPGLARWQDRLNGLNQFAAYGCNCNRPTLESIRAAGFAVEDVEHAALQKVPPTVRPLVIGTGTAVRKVLA